MPEANLSSTTSSSSTDDVLIAIFRRWKAQERSLDAMDYDDEPEFAAACNVADDIARESLDIPATGGAGLAVKALLALHALYGGVLGHGDVPAIPVDDDGIEASLAMSLFADVADALTAI